MLTCELCGGSEILKKDGVFVCETCGTKYSLEEARKLMGQKPVEVAGTVAIDNTQNLNNLVSLAEVAAEGGDVSGVVNYCNKIIELDSTYYQAYFLLSKTIGWDSSLSEDKINLAISYGKKAVQYCPDAIKSEIADEIWAYIKKQLYELIQMALDYEYPNARTRYYKISEYMKKMVNCLTQIPHIRLEVLETELQTIRGFEVNKRHLAMTTSIDDFLPIIVKKSVKFCNNGVLFSEPLELLVEQKRK